MVVNRCRCFMSASVSCFILLSDWKSINDEMRISCSIFRLRYTQPDLIRPIKVPMIYPILYLLATAFVTIVPMIASPRETGVGLLMILTSVPVYFIFIAWQSKPKAFQKTMGEYSRFAFRQTTSFHEHNLQELLTKNCKNYWWWFGQSLHRFSFVLFFISFLLSLKDFLASMIIILLCNQTLLLSIPKSEIAFHLRIKVPVLILFVRVVAVSLTQVLQKLLIVVGKSAKPTQV